MMSTRIADASARAGREWIRLDRPHDLPDSTQVDPVFVDWSSREADWGSELASWRGSVAGDAPRIVLFGPHTDLAAHQEAREAGVGPVLARSRLLSALPALVGPAS
jgi:hypothetical protein